MKKVNEKGFTLAELLIVVAIIAVLVAVAIPSFTSYLEKSREAADLSNLRSAYSAATAYILAHQENTERTLYFDPSTSENIVTTGGARIGRKASVTGQQSSESNLTFNTDYQFGPTVDDTGTLANNKPDSNAKIAISLSKSNQILKVSFVDDVSAIKSIAVKTGVTKAYTLAETTKVAAADLDALVITVSSYVEDDKDISYKIADSDPVAYESDFKFYYGPSDAEDISDLDGEITVGTTAINSPITTSKAFYVVYKGQIAKVSGITFTTA